MSLVEVAIAHQNPIAVFETAPVAVDIVDQNTILVENTPVVGVVQYIAIKGDPGEDGHTPDWANPGDVADLIEALSGQITATQLHSDLLAPIQKIDVGPTSLEARAAMLESADSLLNTAIAENAGRIAVSEAAITTIDGQITELGVDTQTLDGRITGNAAAIDSLETRVTVNESDIYTQAQQITGLSTRVDIAEADQSAQAIIINQNTTAITALGGDITSIASSISTIQADVADNTASIQTNATAIATLDGEVSTEYTLKTDVNGKIAGFGLFNDGTISIFEILADRFAITNGLNSGIVPFIVDGANVYIQNALITNLTSDNIQAYSITADSIDADSVRAAVLVADSITADMYYELRQTIAFTGADSLDASYPLSVPFKIPSETTSVISVKVSLIVQPWRSYELTMPAGGGGTSEAATSYVVSSSSGGTGLYTTTGTSTPSATTGGVYSTTNITSVTAYDFTSTESTTSHNHDLVYGKVIAQLPAHQHVLSDSWYGGHTHSISLAAHTHTSTIAAHSHTIPNHIHYLQHGIFEDAVGAVVYLQVLVSGGWLTVGGPYPVEATDIDITSHIALTGVGWKYVRVTASDRCRVSVIIECKVDITA